jgi:hypothetical protein
MLSIPCDFLMRGGRKYTGLGQPSTGHYQEGFGEGEGDVYDSACRMWTETVMNVEHL